MECNMLGHGQQIGDNSIGVLMNPEIIQINPPQMGTTTQASPNQGMQLLIYSTKHIIIDYQHFITIYSISFLNVQQNPFQKQNLRLKGRSQKLHLIMSHRIFHIPQLLKVTILKKLLFILSYSCMQKYSLFFPFFNVYF